ncbi:MAG: hypothetical protein R6V56_07095 [Lentisphaeria bacterium]
MRISEKIKFSVILGLALMLAAGCRQAEEPPAYNRLRMQIIADLFEALQNENAQAALNSADRLEAMGADTPFLTLVKAREEARFEALKVNSLLLQAKPDQAREFMADHDQLSQFAPDREDRMTEAVKAVKALQDYLEQQPYPQPAKALKELQHLENEYQILAAVEQFTEWRSQQRQRLVSLEADAITKHMASSFSDSNAQKPETGRTALISRLVNFTEQYPDHELAEAYKYLQGNDQKFQKFLRKNNKNDEVRSILSALIGFQWNDLPEAKITAAYNYMKNMKCSTPADWRTKALLTAASGEAAESLRYAKRMLRSGGVPDNTFVKYLLDKVVLPPAQFTARPWRTPLPQLNDFLDIATQIKESN